jgi:hypothetical protein
MRTLLFLSILAAGTAAAQQPAPSEPEKKPRPLNLKIDEAPRAAPRVTFDTKDEKAATSNLPGLGAGARAIDKQPPARPGNSGSPYPADTNPNLR